MKDWHVSGQKVVCIDSLTNFQRIVAARAGVAAPELGKIYTIRGVEPDPNGSSCVYLTFVEIVNPKFAILGGKEVMFGCCSFKPVDPVRKSESFEVLDKIRRDVEAQHKVGTKVVEPA